MSIVVVAAVIVGPGGRVLAAQRAEPAAPAEIGRAHV